MKISEKLNIINNEKLKVCKELKEEIKSLKTDQKLQESLLSTWADIHNQIEETDELTEDYYFDTYLGVMNRTEEKEYGKENLNMAAHNLMQTHELLEEASESMYLCVMENQKRIAALFARLWNNSKQTMEFLGTEKALKHAIALWNVQEFMDDLYEIALEIPEDVNDRVEELIDALVDYEMPGEQKITKLWEPEDDEDLPFN